MLKVTIQNNEVNFTGFTFRQFALLERLVSEAARAGGYQIDIVEYEAMEAAIHNANATMLFDLDKEKSDIEKAIQRINLSI